MGSKGEAGGVQAKSPISLPCYHVVVQQVLIEKKIKKQFKPRGALAQSPQNIHHWIRKPLAYKFMYSPSLWVICKLNFKTNL